jgi:hypothetical protein
MMTCRLCREEHKPDALVCPHCHRLTVIGRDLRRKREFRSLLLRGLFALTVVATFPYWIGPFSSLFGQILAQNVKLVPTESSHKGPVKGGQAVKAAPEVPLKKD